MSGSRAILTAVQPRLLLLDARADGKRLALHGRAGSKQHFKRVARRMPHGEHHAAGGNLPIARNHARDAPILDPQSRERRFKPHVAAQPHDFLPYRLHHAGKPVGADVRLGVDEDVLARAERGELL